MSGRLGSGLTAFAILVVASATAAADEAAPRSSPPPGDEDSPARREARALFAAGNQRFENNELTRAVELYRSALALWDRPIIHFNLAVALIELDRAREAVVHLERALQGPDELGERTAEARNYLRLLRSRLSTLVVRCAAGARCAVDGEDVEPSSPVLLLEAGSHLVVGHRPGFETWSQTVVLEPGQEQAVDVDVERPRVGVVRRWSPVLPWLTVGGGLVVAIGGGVALVDGNARMDRANEELRRRCATPCLGVPDDLARSVDRAQRMQRLGAVAIAAGSAVTITGLALIYLNQPRVVRGTNARVGFALDAHGVSIEVRGAL